MAEQTMSCPVCGKRYKWYETECPTCHRPLVPFKDEPPVAVFQTDDPGALALATIALDGAAIEYVVNRAGSARSLAWRDQFGSSPTFEMPAEIIVPAQDAARARDLLSDLESAPAASAERVTPPAADAAAPPDRGSIELRDTATNALAGHITSAQLEFLRDQLEEESTTDRDYYFTAATIDLLEAEHGDASLIGLLRRALGGREGIELRWGKG